MLGITARPVRAAGNRTGVRQGAEKPRRSSTSKAEHQSGNRIFRGLLAPDPVDSPRDPLSRQLHPAQSPVLANVDDVNESVGFWAPQPDFRILERLSPGFGTFNDLELEAAYQDQVRTFIDYQVRVTLHAIERNPDADLVMGYIEQPDGAGHQFLMIDPRQPSDSRDATSIGSNQDPVKRARYRRYLRAAYRVANDAIQRIIDKVGVDRDGRPSQQIVVVHPTTASPRSTRRST